MGHLMTFIRNVVIQKLFRIYKKKIPVNIGSQIQCTLGSKTRDVRLNLINRNEPMVFRISGKDIELQHPVGA